RLRRPSASQFPRCPVPTPRTKPSCPRRSPPSGWTSHRSAPPAREQGSWTRRERSPRRGWRRARCARRGGAPQLRKASDEHCPCALTWQLGREVRKSRPTRLDRVTYVFAFDQKHRRAPMDMKDLLGGKGANLAEMTSVLGLPVPAGFTISTDACRAY